MGALILTVNLLAVAAAADPAGDQPGGYVESSATALAGHATEVTSRVLDAAGKPVSETTELVHNPELRAAEEGAFACVDEGRHDGFTRYAPWEAYYRGRNDMAQALFFPYSQEVGRHGDNYDNDSVQWLVCGVGGADPGHGSRITKAGPGVAFRDSHQTWKLGQSWREGSTPASYTVSLGFETEGPVHVTGGISQTPTDHLKGSFRPPIDDRKMDDIARNGVNGWWEEHCEPHCGGNSSPTGSSDYHGSVVEGLWEFPPPKEVTPDDFLMKVYWVHHCANVTGVCR